MEPARCRERQSHPRGGLEQIKASAWSPFRIRGRHSAVSERNTRRTPCSSSAARTAAGNPSCARPSTVLPWFTEGQSPPPRAAHRQSLRWAAELRLTLNSILGACGVEAELLAHPFGRFQNPKYNPDPKRTFLQPWLYSGAFSPEGETRTSSLSCPSGSHREASLVFSLYVLHTILGIRVLACTRFVPGLGVTHGLSVLVVVIPLQTSSVLIWSSIHLPCVEELFPQQWALVFRMASAVRACEPGGAPRRAGRRRRSPGPNGQEDY